MAGQLDQYPESAARDVGDRSPGCGKSRFVVEPVIRQVMEKGMPLFVYDLKFDVLSRKVWGWWEQYRDRFSAGTKFYCINFSDLSRSHRCNVLQPETLANVSDAMGVAKTILLSMNKTWVRREGEFFIESPINFLAALIWYLRKRAGGRYCTLPHVIELAQTPTKKLLSMLRAEEEIGSLIEVFVEAYQHHSHEMLDGQLASARVPLAKLASPNLYYVLTGDDFGLDINDPGAPKVFCLGGDAAKPEALAPVISLYIDRLCQRVNRPGQLPCALICDEFGSVRAYSMQHTMTTGRANNILPVLAVQDISQLRMRYSRDEVDSIVNTCGNIVCGQVAGETADWLAKRFPRLWEERQSISVAGAGAAAAAGAEQSISYSHQWELGMMASTIANLSSGEFVGVVADDPDDRVDLKAFHGVLKRTEEDEGAWSALVAPKAPRTRGSRRTEPAGVEREVPAARGFWRWRAERAGWMGKDDENGHTVQGSRLGWNVRLRASLRGWFDRWFSGRHGESADEEYEGGDGNIDAGGG